MPQIGRTDKAELAVGLLSATQASSEADAAAGRCYHDVC